MWNRFVLGQLANFVMFNSSLKLSVVCVCARAHALASDLVFFLGSHDQLSHMLLKEQREALLFATHNFPGASRPPSH